MKRPSDILVCCVSTLLALGTVMIFCIISARGSTLGVGVHYLVKHLVWVGLAVAAFFVARRLDYRLLHRYWWLIAAVALVLLVVVLAPGVGTLKNGARRWIRLGPVGFQPSELAKLGLLVTLCALCVRLGDGVRSFWRGLAPCLCLIGVTAGLVLIEPDFGTAALLGGMGVMVVLAAGARLLPVVGFGAFGFGALAALISLSPHRVARIVAFLNPWEHARDVGYQAIHSLVALGSGGVFGRVGTQKLFWLPESDTDFILAIIGEELGLIGTLGVLLVFMLIIRQGLKISKAAPDLFGRLLAFGITVMLALQASIHIAVVTVSMPTKGIALPFVSAGGSALLISMAAVGILVSIARQSEAPAPRRDAVGNMATGTTLFADAAWLRRRHA